jgi:predicted DNA-binding transcriptional regulator AlpA
MGTISRLGTIYNLKLAAARCGLSLRQLQRLLSVGEGPAVIQLSARRVGIAESDLEAWLTSRRRPVPARAA